MNKNCDFYCYRNERKNKKYNIKQPSQIKLVIFDMDGVLVDTISSWKHIHDHFETSNEHSVNDYLRGKIDDLEFIKRDVLLWKKNGELITKKQLEEILNTTKLMRGAEKTINTLKKHKIETAIVSAGLDILAEKVAYKLGINNFLANGVKTNKEGRLTGEGTLGVKLMYKDEAVQALAKKTQISLEQCVSVGNSCFDIPMFETSGLGIAFNPNDECVREAADIIVEGKDLTRILPEITKYF